MSDENTRPPEGEQFPIVYLEDEMKKSYLDYAMSVIVSRALPDARDGLKPVHRRILYAMKDGGYDSTKPYKKSARIVGDVMGKYHPHGDSAIYDAMVRMAQDFSMSLPLVDGQGNFGSMDGDPAAAMRYTEARLEKAGEALLEDIDKDTVDFVPNYDESVLEPSVVPSRVPNLLVNGASGIAVGMATNIPPHNLTEVVDGCIAYVANPEISIEELNEIIKGPDFPTGGYILGQIGIKSAYTTGNGSVKMRSRTSFEEVRPGRQAIIVHEIPYQVNKSRLMERIGELVRDKQIEGISDLRDESDRDGVRVVIELKRDSHQEVVLNQLFKFTPMQTSFGCNMLALDHGRPRTFTLRDFVKVFVEFREEVITRRTIYELAKARDKAHVLAGLAVAVENIDEIISMIRNAKNPIEAREGLMGKRWRVGDVSPLIDLIDDPEYFVDDSGTYQLSEVQAKAILDLRLHRLTGLERDKISGDLKEVTNAIAYFLSVLADRDKMLSVLVDELNEVKEKFGFARRTEIIEAEFESDIESLIQREDMVVTITNQGYAKRVPLDTYRAQRRGGKGRNAMNTKDDDFVTDMFVASTHTPILFFTSRGIVHKMKVWQLPLGSATSKGKAMINLLPLEQGETISVYLRTPEDEEIWDKLDLMFCTSHGSVRRNKLSDFANIRSNGLIAMKLGEGESLVSVKICKEDEDILLASHQGKAIRFNVDNIRVFAGRNSTGVRGMRLPKGDEIMSMSVLKRDTVENILCVSENGYGKRTESTEYRTSGRGGMGVKNMDVTDKTGQVVATFPVSDEHQIMLVTDGGTTIRTPVVDVRVIGRSTQGVKLFTVGKGEKVSSVAWLIEDDEDEDTIETVDGGEETAVVENAETPEAES
ncbi:MAG: DNA gyrase subunit A [Alphaproteobacteria bacterium]|nr:MAG: DNA gyrase subunit A [Alphaproteobacteria bacterium]